MIPNKSNFKFQELTPITGVKPYVLRFWETEFPEISPVLGDSGQKIYARKDVETILRIKKLLFDEKLTIPEAKIQLQNEESVVAAAIHVQNNENKEIAIHSVQEALNFVRSVKTKNNW